MELKKRKFGNIENEEVSEYTLTNNNDLSLSVITYGAIITKINMPDKHGKIKNITVNVNTLEEIIESRPFHGAVVGPVAGRISNAEYVESDTNIELTQNEFKNNLHSGNSGLDTKLWTADFSKEDENLSLILKTTLFDGEDGFPGEREVTVTYTLNEENEIKINYQAETTKKTIFSPTNHVYFNLNGDSSESIHNHDLFINSDYYAVLDAENLPTGELKSVKDTDFDFRELINIKSNLDSEEIQILDREGLDHPFLLNKDSEKPMVILSNSKSGTKIEIFTDCDAVVVYTHNHVHQPLVKNEDVLSKHCGIALETSALPDAVNHDNFGSVWLNSHEKFNSTTTFKFSLID